MTTEGTWVDGKSYNTAYSAEVDIKGESNGKAVIRSVSWE